ncbi:hypothetical protein ACFIOY_19845 [Bradyrhizobium sp. TZ2]
MDGEGARSRQIDETAGAIELITLTSQDAKIHSLAQGAATFEVSFGFTFQITRHSSLPSYFVPILGRTPDQDNSHFPISRIGSIPVTASACDTHEQGEIR